jgi:ATP/maltotriose-dependent transcriptional regulator MalT/DNA-binding SARP family transcriptional activator
MAPMPDRASLGSVDTTRERSISFAPPDPRPTPRDIDGRPPTPVGPGHIAGATPSRSAHLSDEVSGYPIQLGKVQRPALRDETLERPRLLDWLRLKVHGRVVLILADAGYGKTTLLADFSRRTRMRTLWYRMDPDDRDWVTLLHHLVAAGREHDPTFAPATVAALADAGPSGPSRDSVLATFIGELPTIAGSGAVLIFDDFHLVDDAPDARHIARELVANAPERLSIVFASRRAPAIPLSKLRAVGEVADLGTDDLRFDAAETAKLFTETYGRRLDPDVIEDLAVRTEGWIASLQLVQAALRDRSPAEIRRFVRTMNGADHDLYDYLAEEVVGDLEDELQRFLMETSILQVVTPELAEVVSDRDPADVARLTTAAERLTLLSRLSGAPRTHQRYHPLVRGFLEARLRSLDGPDAVAALHRRAAIASADTDWKTAAHHYREAGDIEAMLGVVASAIPTIMGNGQYALAEGFIGPISADRRPAGFDLILSRVDMQQGDYEAAIAASQAVLDSGIDDPVQRDHALLNLMTLATNYGDGEEAIRLAGELAGRTADPNLRAIADVSRLFLTIESAADLEVVNRRLRLMAQAQRETKTHHFGVTMLNLALNSLLQDRIADAITEARDALEALQETTGLVEQSTARVLLASLHLRLGEESVAESLIHEIESAAEHIPNEVFVEAADACDSFGSHLLALRLLGRVGDRTTQTLADRRLLAMARTRMAIRDRDAKSAEHELSEYPTGLPTVVGATAAINALRAHLALVRGDPSAPETLLEAAAESGRLGATGTRRVCELLLAASQGADALGDCCVVIGHSTPWHLTFLAEEIVPFLSEMSPDGRAAVERAAGLHQTRWRHALRRELDQGDSTNVGAARLLEDIGQSEDIRRLRHMARTSRKRPDAAALGRTLARRLAQHVYVEDQGRLSIEVGPRTVLGSTVRRKVLAMLSYLITRPDLAATRDQVLDALWPELDPETAVNSLNQTVYFLRRVIEEDYTDDLSPGYLHHDSDVVWLDPDLVTSRSVQCRQLIRELPPRPTPDDVDRLTLLYRGRFALDFEYEEWAAAYRDNLHATYLEIVERSVSDDLTGGHYDRGIAIARRALDVDASAEQIEVCLLRLYRLTGAHSAAAEQYEHYASVIREEIGVDPPPLDAF